MDKIMVDGKELDREFAVSVWKQIELERAKEAFLNDKDVTEEEGLMAELDWLAETYLEYMYEIMSDLSNHLKNVALMNYDYEVLADDN